MLLGVEVVAIAENKDAVEISTAKRSFRARALIVCAGLQSDRLAKLSGLRIGHRIVPFRGEFYTLPKSRAGLINRLIYPIPDPKLPFVGIYLTRTIDGEIIVGPNAVLGFSREGYEKFSFSAGISSTPWRFQDFGRSSERISRRASPRCETPCGSKATSPNAANIARACRSRDLEPGMAGIRAQAVLRDGTLVHDFLCAETERQLHVCCALARRDIGNLHRAHDRRESSNAVRKIVIETRARIFAVPAFSPRSGLRGNARLAFPGSDEISSPALINWSTGLAVG